MKSQLNSEELILKCIKQLVDTCWNKAPPFFNEVATIIIKQTRYEKNKLVIPQLEPVLGLASVFLHCFKPDNTFCKALFSHFQHTLKLIQAIDRHDLKTSAKRFLIYLCRKLKRILSDPQMKLRHQTPYKPTNYQMFSLYKCQ